MDLQQENEEGGEELEKFDRLMAGYLSGEATRQQIQQLYQMAEQSFSERFKWWVEQHYQNENGTGQIPSQTSREILSNILEKQNNSHKPGYQWWKWAAAAVVLLGMIGWFVSNHQAALQQPLAQSANGYRPIVLKGKQYLHLPDGSSVLMNEGSQLSYYKEQFEKGIRVVELQGEAFFDVQHDQAHRFEVKTGAVTTTVLGTAFNVKTQAKLVTVTVARGLVQVSGNTRTYAKISPDQQITVNTTTDQYNTVKLDAQSALEWKNTNLILDNVTLGQAKQQIEAHYGISLSFTEPSLLDCRITASFLHGEDLETLLRILSEMNAATYTIDGKKAVILGGSCR